MLEFVPVAIVPWLPYLEQEYIKKERESVELRILIMLHVANSYLYDLWPL